MDGMGNFLRFLREEVFRALGYSEDPHKYSHPYCYSQPKTPMATNNSTCTTKGEVGNVAFGQRFFPKKTVCRSSGVSKTWPYYSTAKTWTFGRANGATFKLSVWHSVKPEDPIKNGCEKKSATGNHGSILSIQQITKVNPSPLNCGEVLKFWILGPASQVSS